MYKFSNIHKAIFETKRLVRLKVHLILAILMVVLLNFLPFFRIGNEILNETYDYFSQKYLVATSSQALSKNFHIVTFSEAVYKKYYDQYFTPRELLGESIYWAVDKGAKVVVVDFGLDSPVPSFCMDQNKADNENRQLLNWLRKAAETAEKNGAVILLPELDLTTSNSTSFATHQYFSDLSALLQTFHNNIRQGGVKIAYHKEDFRTRHFSFFSQKLDAQNKPLPPKALSIPVLAAIYQKYLVSDQVNSSYEEKERAVIAANDFIDKQLNLLQSNFQTSKIFTVRDQKGKEIFLISTRNTVLPARLLFSFSEPPAENSSTPEQLEHLLPGKLDGKVVFIGSTWDKMEDFRHTSLQMDLPGVVILANAFYMLSQNQQLRSQSFFVDLIFKLFIVMSVALLLYVIFSIFHGKKLAFSIACLVFIVIPWLIPPTVENFTSFYYFHLTGIVVLIYEFLVELEEFFDKKYISH